MSKKPTPGPWRVESGPCGIDITAKDGVVASGVYEEADAALIAAAPELLELAKKLLVVWSPAPCQSPDCSICREMREEKLRAYALIKRAGG